MLYFNGDIEGLSCNLISLLCTILVVCYVVCFFYTLNACETEKTSNYTCESEFINIWNGKLHFLKRKFIGPTTDPSKSAKNCLHYTCTSDRPANPMSNTDCVFLKVTPINYAQPCALLTTTELQIDCFTPCACSWRNNNGFTIDPCKWLGSTRTCIPCNHIICPSLASYIVDPCPSL